MKIKIEITYEDMQDNGIDYPYTALLNKVVNFGWMYCNGKVTKTRDDYCMIYYFVYTPSYEDILFKKFKRWTPEWKRKKEILFRKF